MARVSRHVGVMIACFLLAALAPSVALAEAIFASHTSVAEFDQIPTAVIETVKNNMVLFYGHTSHGSQIVTGMEMVRAENGFYDFNNGAWTLTLYEPGGDLGNAEETLWVAPTRAALNTPGNDITVVMWSWCGQVSWATEEGINIYLGAMNQLEQEYPDVQFVYMTGHLDGGGPEENLYLRNNQIRAYCAANNKILFDFADIESYDPDDNYYPDETDACGWCETWCGTHECPPCDGCAHSHCFNCYRKGKAFWWMAARMTGWGSQDTIPHVVSVSPEQNGRHAAPSTAISAVFNTAMDPATFTGTTFIVHGDLTGRHQGTITYTDLTRTATFTPTAAFARGEVVTAVLTDDIASLPGVRMQNGYTWSFTVASVGGQGTFLPDTTYAVGSYPKPVIAADVDADGAIDLATGNLGPETITVLDNDGSGGFSQSGEYYASYNPVALAAADMNNDHLTDIVAVGEAGEYFAHVAVLPGIGEGAFDAPNVYTGGSFAYDLCVSDFDADGFLDVARSCNDGIAVYAGMVGGDLILSATIPGVSAVAICAGDLDRDGDIDLAGALGWGGEVAVFLNSGHGTFTSAGTYVSGSNAADILAADVVGNDHCMDIIIVDAADKAVAVLANEGPATFSTPNVTSGPDGPVSATAGDFDGDGDIDIITADADSGTVSYLLNTNNAAIILVLTREVGGNPSSAAAADVDGDGDLDLTVTDFSAAGAVTVLINQDREYIAGDANDDGNVNVGDAVFIITYVFRSGPAPNHPEAADANCDGSINVGDAVYIINYIFRGGPPPCLP